jgi:hypothetical protein
MKNLNILLFVFIAGLLSACKEKVNDKPFLIVYPENLEIQAYAGEKVIFNIQAVSDFRLTQFIISKKFPGETETTIFDSALSVNNFSFQWAFKTPTDIEDDLYIYFKAINEKGYQSVLGRLLVFKGQRLEEFTGLKMYSANSGNTAAFNLETLQSVSVSVDSASRDIQEYQSDTTYQHLSGKWISPSNCQFVKFNTFDYGNASGSTARDAFNAGMKLTEITNIELNDIYIVRILRLAPDEVYAVIKITNLVDTDGKANDYYEFSVKK